MIRECCPDKVKKVYIEAKWQTNIYTIVITQLTENIESSWLLAGTKKLKKAFFRGVPAKPCLINETNNRQTMSHTVQLNSLKQTFFPYFHLIFKRIG